MAGIIDMHAHAFPDAIAARTIETLESGCPVKAVLDGTVTSLLASMDRAGVDASVLACIATKPSQFGSIFSWCREVASSRLLPFPSVHPDDPELAAHVDAIAGAGFKGIKMHPYYQEFSFDEPRMRPFYDAVRRAGLVLLVHAGFDISFPRDRIADPAKLAKVAREFPGLKLVAAHLGAWHDWDEVVRHLVGTPVWLESSFSLQYLPADVVRMIVDRHDPACLLFGSDSPWYDQARAIDEIRSLGLPDDMVRRMLGGNARRLLGIDG